MSHSFFNLTKRNKNNTPVYLQNICQVFCWTLRSMCGGEAGVKVWRRAQINELCVLPSWAPK